MFFFVYVHRDFLLGVRPACLELDRLGSSSQGVRCLERYTVRLCRRRESSAATVSGVRLSAIAPRATQTFSRLKYSCSLMNVEDWERF